MLNKLSNLSKTAIVLIALTAGMILLLNGSAIFNMYSARWRNAPDFETYKADFETIADYAYTEYTDARLEGDERLVFKIVQNDEGGYYIATNNVILNLDKAEQECLNNVVKAYTYEYAFPSEVIVYSSRVSFHLHSGQYVLVRSLDGTEPDFAYSPTKKEKIHVREIGDGWYEIAVDK